MLANKRFFQWWISVLLIGTGFFWASYFGLTLKIWNTDVTMITSIIAIIFLFANYEISKVTRLIDSFKPNRYNAPALRKSIADKSETVWFLSEQIMALGMLGTVIGLIHMLATFTIGTDVSTLPAILGSLWGSMGLALYTNAVGLALSIVLKAQIYFLTLGYRDEAK